MIRCRPAKHGNFFRVTQRGKKIGTVSPNVDGLQVRQTCQTRAFFFTRIQCAEINGVGWTLHLDFAYKFNAILFLRLLSNCQ